MERDKIISKLGTLVAGPALLLTANACDIGNNNTTSEPAPTITGSVLGKTDQPKQDETAEQSAGTIQVNRGAYEYQLYTGVTIDDILKTANSLPESNSKEALIDSIQGAKSLQNISPTHEGIVPSLNRAFNILDNNCDGDTEKEIAKEIASYSGENFPDQYDANSQIYEQGPCSVTGETQVAAPTHEKGKINDDIRSLEPWTNRHGQTVHTVLRDNYAYTYELITIPDVEYALASVVGLIQDPKLLAYIPNPDKRKSIVDKYQKAKDMEKSNPNDPEIPKKILEASMEYAQQCTNGFHATIVKGSASTIYAKDPDFWHENQFSIIDSGCLETKKYIISPQFPIKQLDDGTFIYEGVTYDDVLEFAQNLRPVFPRDSGTMISWLQHAADNQGNPQEEALGLNSAGFLLEAGCTTSDVALNLIRLIDSLGDNPPHSSYHNGCYTNFFNDDYYFER